MSIVSINIDNIIFILEGALEFIAKNLFKAVFWNQCQINRING